MGRNKKEAFVFTLLMCFFMVTGMNFYNVALFTGFSKSLIPEFAVGFLPAFIVALVLDVFIVGKFAKGLAGKIAKEHDPMIKKVLLISCFMVMGMVICMSLYGTIAHYGFTNHFVTDYLTTVCLNLICALPLQLVVVGPLTRFLFSKIYPVGMSKQKLA
ncbi:DUF2798 domain-containing protein [Paenibacillus sp. M1]|uniref:DUF2798 domain-containing protein n=1 Tax=Paenibacillus haidiansis TaxID=1574488 RepID=A0ABU7VTC6_9BACL